MVEQQPLMKFGRDLLAADKRVAKIKGKDALRPSMRLAGSAVMMLLGIGFEWGADKLGPKVVREAGKRLGVDELEIPPWAKEAVTDGGVAIAYAFVQKQIGEQLPKLTPPDLLTLVVDVGAYSGDRAAEGVGNKVKNTLKRDKNARVQVFENVTNWLNPVTAGAIREGLSAGSDLWSAYRDIANGVPEKAEAKKEPITKETTIIFLGNDQQLASALSTVSQDQANS